MTTTRQARSRRRIVAAALIALSLIAGPATARTSNAVRAGTIVGSNTLALGSTSCGTSPDCVAWRASGCSRQLAGVDPAAFTSIVDVGSLAGSTRRLEVTYPVEGWLSTWIEFWRADCSRITYVEIRGDRTLTIPRSARWMTVPTVVGPYVWTLR